MGTHRGVKRLDEFIRKESKNYRENIWILKCDISKFFDSINHDILKNILFKKDLDNHTKWLVENVIKSFEKLPNRGLPLGNVTSQLFANIYLNEFDQFIKHELRAKHYLRYCDDFVIVSRNKKYLESLILEIIESLKNKLDLSLHPRNVEIRKLSQGVDFLGYVRLLHYLVLRTNTKKRILRRIQKIVSKETVQSYLGVLSHCKGHKIAKILIESKNG